MKTFQPPALLSRRKMYMPEYQLELKQLVDYHVAGFTENSSSP